METESKTQISTKELVQENKPICCIKRRYITRSIWAITIIAIILIQVFLSNFYSALISGLCFSLGGIANILLIYIDFKAFTIDAYITIFITYLSIFLQMIIVPVEISLFFSSPSVTSSNQNVFKIIYNVVHYISIIVGTVIIKIQMIYWVQGQPTFKERAWATFKSIFKILLIVLGVFIIFIIILLCVSKTKGSFGNNFNQAIQSVSFVYCGFYFSIFLGYGLFKFPMYFWNYTNSEENLDILTSQMQDSVEDFNRSVNKLFANKTLLFEQCKRITNDFSKEILSELDNYPVEFNSLTKFQRREPSMKKDEVTIVNNKILGEIYTKVKKNYQKMKINQMRMFTILIKIQKNTVDKRDKLQKKETLELSEVKSSSFNKSLVTSNENLDRYLFLIPKVHNIFVIIVTKAFCIFLLIFSAISLFTFINLFIIMGRNTKDIIISPLLSKIPYYQLNFVILFAFQFYVFCCCYYSICQFKFSQCYVLVKHHSDRTILAENSGMTSTVFLGIGYFFILTFAKTHINTELDFLSNTISRLPDWISYIILPVAIILIFIVMIFRSFKSLKFLMLKEEIEAEKIKKTILSKRDISLLIQKVEKLYYDIKLEKDLEASGTMKSDSFKKKEPIIHQGYLKRYKNLFNSSKFYYFLKDNTLTCYQKGKDSKVEKEYVITKVFARIDGEYLILNIECAGKNKELKFLSCKEEISDKKIDLDIWISKFEELKKTLK